MRYFLILFTALFLSACSTNAISPGTTYAATSVGKPKNITLLVPLEGANGNSGQAIRNGFLAAYYYAKQTTPDAPNINVVDTKHDAKNIGALYQQAVAKGTDFVVGPLTKQEVQALAADPKQITVPTLALNTLDSATPVAQLYQFGLSPQDEAAQVAERAKQDGFSRAVMITPQGNWGNEVARAFENQWKSSGGVVTYHLAYPVRGNMTAMVEKAIKTGESPDVVFLVASPNDARQIKPLINFYSHSSLPVYATSSVYAGTPSTMDHDLDGIIFSDMPWIIGTDTPALKQIRNNIQTLWASSYNRSPRLYALGIDAYHLTYTLDRLSSGVEGATGNLSVDANQRIKRAMSWAKFKNGVPEKIE